MLDLDLIRRDPDQVRQALENRGEDDSVGPILELDGRRRESIRIGDELRAYRNQVSQEIGRSQERPLERIQEMRDVGERIKVLEDEVKDIEQQLDGLLLRVPNIPRSDVPVGADEESNVIVRTWGEPRTYTFEPKPHWDLNEALDIIDFQRGVKLSGSRFYVLKGQGARLQLSLIHI